MTAPRVPRLVKESIDQLLSSLIGKGAVDDQNFAVLRQAGAETWEVTFDGAEHVSIAMDDIDYGAIHGELSDKRSFTAKLVDGGLLQLMYLFKHETLVRHRLAYYPSPSLRPFQEDAESYLRGDLYVEVVSRRLVPFPLRFDFDEEAAEDVSHPRCHMTLGDVKRCRVPVSAPISPLVFAEFVLRNFYQTDAHEFVSCLPARGLSFASSITNNERQLIHVVVPEQGEVV